MQDIIRIGISACLLGEKVRYDGGHKLDRFLTDTLGKYVQYLPICPEVECGFPIPRESFRLMGNLETPQFIATRTHVDHTDRMIRWSEKRIKEIGNENLCGFIFKSKSPSCGMERVKVYTESGMPLKKGGGIFAVIFMKHFPLIPVEEEGRLHDPELRENFIERIFTLKRWRENLFENRGVSKIVNFHTRHKLLILSHSPKYYRQMGNLVSHGAKISERQLYEQYEMLLMEALKLKTTLKKHFNVMQHIMGYFKKRLSSDEKKELIEIMEQYRDGYIPLIVPVTLINHYVRKYDQPYLKEQVYLRPHPIALKLRNHA